MIDERWAEPVRRIVRVEMTRAGLTYAELLEALKGIGVDGENERNLRNKVARGTFSAVFLVQCLIAMRVTELRLDEKSFPATPDVPDQARSTPG